MGLIIVESDALNAAHFYAKAISRIIHLVHKRFFMKIRKMFYYWSVFKNMETMSASIERKHACKVLTRIREKVRTQR